MSLLIHITIPYQLHSNMKQLIWLSLFIITSATTITAQSLSPEKLRSRFPEDEAVYLQKHANLLIDFKNNEWEINKNVSEEMYLLDKHKASFFAEKVIHYTGFEEIINVDAKTKIPIKMGKKPKYKEIPIEEIETKDVLSGSIFYSDHKQKQFFFPAVQADAITSLQYTEKSTDPHFLGTFFFSSPVPVLDAQFTVDVPDNVEITYTLLGLPNEAISFKQSKKGNRQIYTWSAKDMKKMEFEANAPNVSYYEPHIAIYINKVKTADQEIEILQNTKSLYKWYSELVKNINPQTDPQLQSIVQKLIKDVPDKTEQIKQIFQWVQSNIKYIAFEDGLGGFVPRDAAEVCQKKYGDCKDMSSIIVEMLKIADIPAYLTWIGTRDRPYSYHNVPSPIVDNHMIAATKINGEYVFLDATGEYLPFQLPTSMIQGKEAMIGLNKNDFEIVKVPVIPKESNTETEFMQIEIVDNDLIGVAEVNFEGYKKVFTEYARLRAESQDNPHFYDEFLRKGNNKFEVTDLDPKGFFNPDSTLTINYQFKIPGYAKKAGNKLYVNLNLKQKYKNQVIDLEERKLDRENEYQYIEKFKVQLTVPEGYQVDYLPEPFEYNTDEFGFVIRYHQKEDTILVTQETYMNFLLLDKSKFPEWNKMIKQLNEAYQEVVVLKAI